MTLDTKITHDDLITIKFVEQLRTYADHQMQLGERDRALIVSKAAQIIQILSWHCMQYNIGIPAHLINSVMVE